MGAPDRQHTRIDPGPPRRGGVLRRGRLVVAVVAIGMLGVSGVATAGSTTAWAPAEEVPNVDAPGVADGCPIESPDGDHLFIASMRGPGGDNDIWVATRGEDGEFETPIMLPAPVNTDADEFCPTPLRGNHLLFVSTRGGVDAYGTAACGGGDIYLARRSPATGAWDEPRNLGCAPDGPNMAGTEFGPSRVETDDGTILYFSSGGGPGTNTQDVYMSWLQPDGTYGAPSAVAELNTGDWDDMMPNVSKDGRELVLASNRPGGEGSFDIWVSTRDSVGDVWSPPVNLGPAVNTAAGETRPSLSWKGERLYFGRAGVIFVSTRTKQTGPPS